MTDKLQRPGISAEGSAGPEGGRVAPARRTEGSPAAKRGGSGAARLRRAGETGGEEPKKTRLDWMSKTVLLICCFLFVALLAGVFFLALGSTCVGEVPITSDCDQSRWSHLISAPFNVIGDTLAGFAGMAAIIGLLATIVLQRYQLRIAELDSIEVRKSLFEQSNLLKVERTARIAELADAELTEKIRTLLQLATESRGPVWTTSHLYDVNGQKEKREMRNEQRLLPSVAGHSDEEGFGAICRELPKKTRVVLDAAREERLIAKAERDGQLDKVRAKLEEILNLREDISPARQEWLKRMDVKHAFEQLELLLQSNVWNEDTPQ